MARKATKAALSPARIMEDMMGAWRSRAIASGIELDVFTRISEGKRSVRDIAAATGASERGLTNLLDSLAAIGYLRKSGTRYSLTPVPAEFLVRGKKTYMGAMAGPCALTWSKWEHLTDVVKQGRPPQAIDSAEVGKEFFPQLVASLFPGNFRTSSTIVSRLTEKERRSIRQILDVAAGSGAWSLAFAQAIPEARVATVDFPEMTPITRKFAAQAGVEGRYEYHEGDLRKVDFGTEIYDLVILGHIIHTEGEKHGKELIRRSYEALQPGGKLLIAEFVPNDSRTGPEMPVLFGLNMLLHTDEGNVFTMKEYRAWLKEAGFRKVATVPVPPPATIIWATK